MGERPPQDEGAPAGGEPEDHEIIEIPVEDALDLHFFHPREVKVVVEEYLVQCRERGFAEVRIIHGRGTGMQRASVRALLERSPHVLAFRDAEGARGGWGATIVRLRPDPERA